MRPFYVFNGNSCTGKAISLYWDDLQEHLYDLTGICWNIYDSSSQDLAFSVTFYATFLLPNESLFSIFNKWHYQIPPDFYAASLPWSDLINVLCSRDPWTLGVHQAWSITVTILRRHYHMMTSSNANIFCVTGRWMLLTTANDVELWCFLWSAPEQSGE